MEEFETFIKSLVNARTSAFGYNHNDMEDAWQESLKQSAAEIAHLETIIENLEMAVASFTDSRVDLVNQEREWWSEYFANRIERELADRIEQV